MTVAGRPIVGVLTATRIGLLALSPFRHGCSSFLARHLDLPGFAQLNTCQKFHSDDDYTLYSSGLLFVCILFYPVLFRHQVAD